MAAIRITNFPRMEIDIAVYSTSFACACGFEGRRIELIAHLKGVDLAEHFAAIRVAGKIAPQRLVYHYLQRPEL